MVPIDTLRSLKDDVMRLKTMLGETIEEHRGD